MAIIATLKCSSPENYGVANSNHPSKFFQDYYLSFSFAGDVLRCIRLRKLFTT